MSKRLILLLMVLGLCLTPALRAANIIWVSDQYDERPDGIPDDQDAVDFLISLGHSVDNTAGAAAGNGYWRTLDNDKIAALNAADVVIVSRNSDSGNYASDATEIARWNGVTAPLILMSPYISRSSRWVWYNNDTLSEDGGTPTLVAVGPHHPIFMDVELDANGRVDIYDQSVGSGTVSFAGVLDNGNGTLLAQALDGERTMIAEWDAGIPFYAGGAQTPAGKRMLFCGGTREGEGFGRGEFNLNDEGKKLLANAIEYMVGNLVREPWVKAWKPDPPDGAEAVALALFQWTAGETAVAHSVYFGTTPELTEADLVATRIPVALYYHVPGLEPGMTYYWRIDEVELDGTTHEGDVWTFSVAPLTAYRPEPKDGAKWIELAAITLTWSPGQNALSHDVYFGTDETAVAEGTGDTFQGNQAQTTYDPGILDADTMYYWRVDEVLLGGTKETGEVWSFRTLGEGGGLRGLYYANDALSGMTVIDRIDPQIDFDWGDATPDPALPNDNFSVRWVGEIDVPFTETYTFYANTEDGVRLWVNDVQIMDLWQNRRAPTEAKAPIDLVGGQRYSIVMEYYDSSGVAVAQLSWESPSTPKAIIPQGAFSLALRASGPKPANGAVDVTQSPILMWSAGEEAAQHQVYFGDDPNAVADANTSTAGVYRGQQALDATSYDPGPLEWNKTYYWRVDEANLAGPDGPWIGSVWSFTTADFFIVEDFESYDDADNRIYLTWIDGVDNGTTSYVGYPVADYGTFGETVIVYSGDQSMPLDANNVNAPYYGETTRAFAPALNMTVNGMDTLTLYVRGQATNDAIPLYVGLKSGATRVNVLVPDATIAQTTSWQEVNIPLADFAPVNAAAVNEMAISLGNPDAPTPDGAALIYVDAIRATKAAPAE